MMRKWFFYIAGLLSGGIFVIDRFIYSIDKIFLYVSTFLVCILMVIYILTDKKNYFFFKVSWKSWNTAQKIVLLLIIILNIYILGEVDLFSKFIYFIFYICMNYSVYILFLKTESENKKIN